MNSFGAHFRNELLRIIIRQILIVLRKGFKNFKIFLFSQEIALVLIFISTDSGLDYHISFIIDDTLQFLGTHAKQITGFIWKALEIPDMNYGYHKFDMTHPFAANLLFCYFNTTPITYDPFITDPFIFSAGTFVILYRSENAFTEQTIPFGFICSVVYRFRL